MPERPALQGSINHVAFEEDVAAAALWLLPWSLLFALVLWLAPPTAEQLAASDPLVQVFALGPGVLAIAGLAVVAAVAWNLRSAPGRDALRRSARGAVLGAGLAGLGLPLVRLLAGPALPGFIPPEESAAPGLALGLAAGVLEEVVFRLGVLAVVFRVLEGAVSRRAALLAAVGISGLAFSLSHELGPGAGDCELRFLVSRFLVPGCFMSALFFRPGPTFLVTLHVAAHVGIWALFVAPG